MLLANVMILGVMPPWFMRLPARMNPGTHSSTNEFMPANIFWARLISGIPSTMKYSSEEIPRENATGTPSASNTRKLRNKTSSIYFASLHFISPTVLITLRTRTPMICTVSIRREK